MFFQYNPLATVHGDVHWGHVSSDDLITWSEEPIALRPRPGTVDAAGCWSGCVVDDGGVPTAVYTGVPTSALDAGVVLARTDRTLRTWRQDDRHQVGLPDDPLITEVRDPFLFDFEGHRYAVQGAGSAHGLPQLLLYGCDDLTDWQPLGPLLTADDPMAATVAQAQIWECPNLFRSGDQWILVFSLWRYQNGSHALSGVRYLIGDLRPRRDGGLGFVPGSSGLVDAGPTFYAPQVLVEPGRVLLWGWAWEGAERNLADVTAAGWAGVLTFPRELVVADGHLVSRPAAELTRLRREPVSWRPGVEFPGTAFEIETSGSLRLSISEQGVDTLVVATEGPARILVDGSVVEMFAEGPAWTSRVYPRPTSRWRIETDAAQTEIWRLGLD